MISEPPHSGKTLRQGQGGCLKFKWRCKDQQHRQAYYKIKTQSANPDLGPMLAVCSWASSEALWSSFSLLLPQGLCPPVFVSFNYLVSSSFPSTCKSTHISKAFFKTPLCQLKFSQQIRSKTSKELTRPAVLCQSLTSTIPPKLHGPKSPPMPACLPVLKLHWSSLGHRP